MFKNFITTAEIQQNIQDIEFKVIYSRRRTIGISVLRDSSVVVRVPYRTSGKTINRIVEERASWIIKHRDNYRKLNVNNKARHYADGEIHLFRGKDYVLKVEKAGRPYIRFGEGIIELGLSRSTDPGAIKSLLYQGYKNEAASIFPLILSSLLTTYKDHDFKPETLVIRKMSRRWGSCSNKSVITLSTELMKVPDLYIEYVVTHELCHLKHHNHGAGYYALLSRLFPEWKKVRKELQKFIR